MTPSPKESRLSFALTIRAKLTLITLMLLVGIGCYAAFQQVSFNTLNRLDIAATENLLSEVDLLTLRRHEKDFLARKDAKYVERFDKTSEQLLVRVSQLNTLVSEFDPSIGQQVDQVIQTVKDYQIQFHQLVSSVNQIGQSGQSGLTQDLELTRESLREQVSYLNDSDLTKALFSLYTYDNLYLATPSESAFLDVQNALRTLLLISESYPLVDSAVQNYQQAITKLADAKTTFGLTPQQGLRGALRNNVHQTEEIIHILQQDIEALINSKTTSVKQQLYAFGACIALLVSLLLILIGRNIANRIGAINMLMDKIARGEGDLTVRMNAKGNDELVQLSNSFDLFISSLHGNIKDLAKVMNVLSENSCSSEKAAMQSMKNAEQQKMESESVATAVNELVMTSNEITANIEHAAENAKRVKLEAERGRTLTHEAGQSIQTLTSNIESSQELVSELETCSRDIHSVITSIQGIAEQTNLLALNAAIEAARAGDNGRGFAVVADEVRQLSLMTNTSTHEIETTINGLTTGVQKTVSLMQSSLEQAHHSNEQTENVVGAIDKIVDQISEMFDMNAQIATASEEQSMVSAEIDRNITQIAELAGDTHQIVTGSVRCSEQVSDVSHKLEAIVAQFKY
ncbi:methyl-accepting chemotaxis protein [Vibrio sp. TRT 17S01]|uniref:methyl-accepting chemotaxis protein n=1 Tax=Vibrio sp. TRT 17S01 TaxID=3418505 RepID=UPI003CED6E91